MTKFYVRDSAICHSFHNFALWHTDCSNLNKTEKTILTKIKTVKTMNVKPLSDRVLVKPNPAEEMTASGLIIPDTAKEKPLAGKVVAAGPGTADVKMEVKVGDEVLYGKYAGTELHIDGEDYLMMKQQDILAVVEK
jgi:chaperonin GroES